METPVKNRQKYPKTVKNNKKQKKPSKYQKTGKNIEKPIKKPSKKS